MDQSHNEDFTMLVNNLKTFLNKLDNLPKQPVNYIKWRCANTTNEIKPLMLGLCVDPSRKFDGIMYSHTHILSKNGRIHLLSPDYYTFLHSVETSVIDDDDITSVTLFACANNKNTKENRYIAVKTINNPTTREICFYNNPCVIGTISPQVLPQSSWTVTSWSIEVKYKDTLRYNTSMGIPITLNYVTPMPF